MGGQKRIPRLLGPKFKKTDSLVSLAEALSKRRGDGSELDRIYGIIEEECCRGYLLTDSEYGLPLIRKESLEDKGDGIWVVRFRLKDGFSYRLERLVESANNRFLSGKHLLYEKREEYGIPFLECIWIINENELLPELEEDEFYLKRDFKGRFDHMSRCSENWDSLFKKYCEGKGIADVARFIGYSEENLMFLECEEKDKNAKIAIAKKFPDTIKYLNDPNTKGRIGENRTPLQYSKDLIAGWIGEDLFRMNLNDNGIEVELNGADRERKILPSEKVSTKPDIMIRLGGGEWRECELMMEHSGFLSNEKVVVLRNNKFKRLVERKCMFIDLEFSTGEYVIIDFSRGTPKYKFVEHYDNWGGKPAYIIHLDENGIPLRNHEKLIDELKKRLSPKKETSPTTRKTMVLDVPTNEESKKMVEAAYEKAKEERKVDNNHKEEESEQPESDSAEMPSDDAGESSTDDEISSWEQQHEELAGWV